MKKITTVEGLKQACAEVKASGGKEYVTVSLNEQMVDFLYSIYGKNRPETAIQIAAIYSTIKNGDWDENQGTMTINASCNWLCSGHHRIIAIKHAGVFNMSVDIQILQDKDAERKFLTDDTLIATRSSAQQARMFLGVSLAKECHAIMRALETLRGNFNAKFGPNEIARFNLEHETFLRQHRLGFSSIRGIHRRAHIPATFYALYFYLAENGKDELAKRAIELIDEVGDANTKHEQARVIREVVLENGEGATSEAIPIFYKAVVKGDLPRTKAFVKQTEIGSIKEALGISTVSNTRKTAKVGSRNYFTRILNDIRG